MCRLTRVVPALLTDDPQALATMVRQAETFTDYIQFDFMDGQFVPSRSVTWEHLATLPMKLHWEAHLMVLRPEDYLVNLQKAGAQRIIFHYEATASPREVIALVRQLGLEVGLAVNPETAVSSILPLLPALDSVLLLSVHPGFYGAQFIPEVLDKVVELRSIYPELEIGIDGGIKESNIVTVAEAGVDVIYVGSAIFLQPQPADCFQHLQALAEKGSKQQSQ